MMGCHGIAPPNQGRGRRNGAFWGSDGGRLTVFDVSAVVAPQERPAEAVFWLALASLRVRRVQSSPVTTGSQLLSAVTPSPEHRASRPVTLCRRPASVITSHSGAMATQTLGACMACRCVHVLSSVGTFTGSKRSIDTGVLQGSESGKSVSPRMKLLNLINHYATGIPTAPSKKCTPGTPRCARCTAMGIEDCSYGSVKKRGVGNTLRMGQACIPCR
jgi:hypothetical protein